MAKNLFTDIKNRAGAFGLNPTGYVQQTLDYGGGEKDFSPTATNVIPPDASKGKTVSLITPDTDGVDYLSQLLTTPEQEAEYRKDNINAQKIGLIGDALRQVGNVITTSQGAVPQKFGASPLVGLAAEYKADKAKRDANNLRYYSAKQQERIQAAKDALARQQMAYNLWKDKQNWDYKVSRDKANDALKKYGIEQQNARQREKMKFDAEQKELDRKNATRNAYIRKSNSGSEGAGSGRYMVSPNGVWSRKTDLSSNELKNAVEMLRSKGYTIPIDPMLMEQYKEAQLRNDSETMSTLETISELKTRDALMQIMATDVDASKLVGERFGFTFQPSRDYVPPVVSRGEKPAENPRITTHINDKFPKTKWQQDDEKKTKNGLEDVTDLLGI